MERAMGIENNTDWNFKDLGEIRGSAKALKKNNGECREILIGPSFSTPRNSLGCFADRLEVRVGSGSNFAARMAADH
jgi:hypothetical protein